MPPVTTAVRHRPLLTPARQSVDPGGGARWAAPLALGLIVAVTLARAYYLARLSSLDLSPDEAHYWDWSRHLDWSYYSKGPGVAFLIRGSCELLGGLSQSLAGSLTIAVRVPAMLCGALTLWGLFTLTRRMYGRDWLALGVVAAGVTFPALAVGSLLMTIDAPFLCCWTWATVVAHGLVTSDRRPLTRATWPGWAVLGLLVGVGILFKYTMVLFLPSLGLFLVLYPGERPLPWRRRLPAGFWLTSAVTALCCLPIVIWNARHGWVTLLHVARQSGVRGAGGISWLGPLDYVGGQMGLLLGFWFVGWAAAMTRVTLGKRPDQSPRERSNELYLWCLSAPTFLVFLVFSFKTRIELNWPITAYVTGLVLAAGWVVRQCQSGVAWWRRLSRATVAISLILGLSATVVMHHTEWLYRFAPPDGPGVSSVRRWDPTCRLRGWQTLASAIAERRRTLRKEGVEARLAASGWALPGIMGIYQEDLPEVFSFARASGGRFSQYDFWRPNPVSDPDRFRGQTFVYVGEVGPVVREAFDHVEETTWVAHVVAGRQVAAWPITVCRGFKGFKDLAATGY